jgi:hypothetical protein
MQKEVKAINAEKKTSKKEDTDFCIFQRLTLTINGRLEELTDLEAWNVFRRL